MKNNFNKNQRFITSGGDKTIRLWDIETKKMLEVSKRFETDIRAIDWSSKGDFIVAGDVKGHIYILDLKLIV